MTPVFNLFHPRLTIKVLVPDQGHVYIAPASIYFFRYPSEIRNEIVGGARGRLAHISQAIQTITTPELLIHMQEKDCNSNKVYAYQFVRYKREVQPL